MTKPIPSGYHAVTPSLTLKDSKKAIEFYKKAFGAQELARLMTPDGKTVMHGQLKIGDSMLMLGGEMPPHCLSPKSRGGTSVTLHIYTADADAAFDRAVKAGCTVRMPVSDTFWGDHYGVVEDPFGHQWAIATHRHDYTPEQIAANAREFMARMPKH